MWSVSWLSGGGPLSALLLSVWRLTSPPPSPELLVAYDLRPGVLRGGDDAHGGAALRHGPLRGGVPRQPASVRRHDRRRDAHQQDGPRATEGEGEGRSCDARDTETRAGRHVKRPMTSQVGVST